MGRNPILEHLVVNENSIASITAELTVTLGLNGSLFAKQTQTLHGN